MLKITFYVWYHTPHFHAKQSLRIPICLSWSEQPVKNIKKESYIKHEANIRVQQHLSSNPQEYACDWQFRSLTIRVAE